MTTRGRAHVDRPGTSRRVAAAAAASARCLVLCAMTFTPCAIQAVRAQPDGAVAGAVADTTGLPLEGVSVAVRGVVDRVVQTAADGSFDVTGLPPGDYELVVSREGYASVRRAVRVTSGRTTIGSLTLTPHLDERVIVTAAKAGEDGLHSTPMAVSVLSGSELERLESHDISGIAGLAPSLTFSQNSDFGQLTIRGIGTNVVFAGSDPSSAVYLDGVYLARPVMALSEFLDLERIEVLRGPQGTLYGRNAVGGAVNLITKSPTNDAESSARLVAGSNGELRAQARASGPLVPGRLLGSAAFVRGVRRGFVEDVDHPGDELGGEDVTAFRGQLRTIFNARTELSIGGDFTHKDPIPLTYAKVLEVKPGFDVDNPPDLHEVRTSTPAESRTLQYGATARLAVDLTPSIRVNSLSAFRKLDYRVINDSDITELDLVAVNLHEVQHQLSEELTVAHRDPGRLTWLAGIFLLHDVDSQPTVIRLSAPQLENVLTPRVDATSRSAFGQATIRLTRSVSATGGLRYTNERKVIDNAGQLHPIGRPLEPVPASVYAYEDAISSAAWTPRIGFEVQPSANVLTYVSASRGFKSGGFNLTSPVPGRGYLPEWAWSYEGGLKITGGRRAAVSASAFWMNYTDLQVQTAIRPGVIDISNAAAATIRGVELEGAAGPLPGLRAGGHLSFLDTRYDRYVAVGVGGVTGDVAGRRLTNAPVWSGRLWLEWERRLGRSWSLDAMVDTAWQTTVYFTPFNDAIQRQSPHALVNVRTEVGPTNGPWSLAAYARNLSNTDYITGTFATPPPAIGGRPGDARQLGLQFAVRR